MSYFFTSKQRIKEVREQKKHKTERKRPNKSHFNRLLFSPFSFPPVKRELLCFNSLRDVPS